MYMQFWFDCPVCGKESSCHGNSFCGSCEQKFREEEDAWLAKEEAKRVALSNRVFIRDTNGQSVETGEYAGESPHQGYIMVRRVSGVIEHLAFMGPAEIPGGGSCVILGEIS